VIAIPLVVVLAGAAAVYNQSALIESAVKNATVEAVERYDNGTRDAVHVDEIQRAVSRRRNRPRLQLRCCGATGVHDYEAAPKWWTEHPGHYPASCCRKSTLPSRERYASVADCDGRPFENADDAFDEGCFTLIDGALEENAKWLAAGTAAAVAVLVRCVRLCARRATFARRRSAS